jgi:hypothetical protein
MHSNVHIFQLFESNQLGNGKYGAYLTISRQSVHLCRIQRRKPPYGKTRDVPSSSVQARPVKRPYQHSLEWYGRFNIAHHTATTRRKQSNFIVFLQQRWAGCNITFLATVYLTSQWSFYMDSSLFRPSPGLWTWYVTSVVGPAGGAHTVK